MAAKTYLSPSSSKMGDMTLTSFPRWVIIPPRARDPAKRKLSEKVPHSIDGNQDQFVRNKDQAADDAEIDAAHALASFELFFREEQASLGPAEGFETESGKFEPQSFVVNAAARDIPSGWLTKRRRSSSRVPFSLPHRFPRHSRELHPGQVTLGDVHPGSPSASSLEDPLQDRESKPSESASEINGMHSTDVSKNHCAAPCIRNHPCSPGGSGLTDESKDGGRERLAEDEGGMEVQGAVVGGNRSPPCDTFPGTGVETARAPMPAPNALAAAPPRPLPPVIAAAAFPSGAVAPAAMSPASTATLDFVPIGGTSLTMGMRVPVGSQPAAAPRASGPQGPRSVVESGPRSEPIGGAESAAGVGDQGPAASTAKDGQEELRVEQAAGREEDSVAVQENANNLAAASGCFGGAKTLSRKRMPSSASTRVSTGAAGAAVVPGRGKRRTETEGGGEEKRGRGDACEERNEEGGVEKGGTEEEGESDRTRGAEGGGVVDEKRQKRREANRMSARLTIRKKQALSMSLRQQLQALAEENGQLRLSIAAARGKLARLAAHGTFLTAQLQHSVKAALPPAPLPPRTSAPPPFLVPIGAAAAAAAPSVNDHAQIQEAAPVPQPTDVSSLNSRSGSPCGAVAATGNSDVSSSSSGTAALTGSSPRLSSSEPHRLLGGPSAFTLPPSGLFPPWRFCFPSLPPPPALHPHLQHLLHRQQPQQHLPQHLLLPASPSHLPPPPSPTQAPPFLRPPICPTPTHFLPHSPSSPNDSRLGPGTASGPQKSRLRPQVSSPGAGFKASDCTVPQLPSSTGPQGSPLSHSVSPVPSPITDRVSMRGCSGGQPKCLPPYPWVTPASAPTVRSLHSAPPFQSPPTAPPFVSRSMGPLPPTLIASPEKPSHPSPAAAAAPAAPASPIAVAAAADGSPETPSTHNQPPMFVHGNPRPSVQLMTPRQKQQQRKLQRHQKRQQQQQGPHKKVHEGAPVPGRWLGEPIPPAATSSRRDLFGCSDSVVVGVSGSSSGVGPTADALAGNRDGTDDLMSSGPSTPAARSSHQPPGVQKPVGYTSSAAQVETAPKGSSALKRQVMAASHLLPPLANRSASPPLQAVRKNSLGCSTGSESTGPPSTANVAGVWAKAASAAMVGTSAALAAAAAAAEARRRRREVTRSLSLRRMRRGVQEADRGCH